MKISELKKALSKSFIELEAEVGDGAKIKFKVRADKLTGEMYALLTSPSEAGLGDDAEAYINTCIKALIDEWDLTDDEGNEYPRDDESLSKLPFAVRWAVMRELPRAFAPNFQQ